MPGAVLTSCGDFLEEYSQDTAYVRNYSDLDELLLGDGYIPTGIPRGIADPKYDYKNYEYYYYPYIHLMADEVDYNIYTTSEANSVNGYAADEFFGYYTWQQLVGLSVDGTTLTATDGDWNRIYKHINICNMVLADIDDMEAKASEQIEKQRIKGEAYFLRGAYYFTLANLYGKPYSPATAASDLAVPIKLTEYIEDRTFQRNTVAEVYAQAENDLKEAERFLDGTSRKSFYRANITSARLLLSRLYLYKQDYDNAIKYAQAVIDANDNRLADLNGFSADYFLNPGLSEVIFSMGTGGLRRSINSGYRAFSITSDFYSLYSASGDLRTTWFVRPNASYSNYPEYIKGGDSSQLSRASLSHNFLLRTAEAYLNLAEAAACKGDNGMAKNALNDLRRKRIDAAAYTDVTKAGADLVSYIRDERARELCLEGHRWFDLRRYAVNDAYPFVKTIRHNYTIHKQGPLDWTTWTYPMVPQTSRFYELRTDESANTLPIPTEVIDFNFGMVNNPRAERPAIETVNY